MTTTVSRPATDDAAAAAPEATEPSPRRRIPWAGRAGRTGKAGILVWIAGVWLGGIVLLAVFADLLPLPSHIDTTGPPGGDPGLRWPDFLGYDTIGRSMLSRIVYGARVSLVVAVLGTIFGIVVGGLLGLIAGYARGWIEAIIDTLTASLMAFPSLVLVIALIAIVGPNIATLVVSLGLLAVPAFTRVVKATVMSVTGKEFILAARSLAASPFRVMFKEILPNVLVPVFSLASMTLALLIIVEGSLSFLGLGIPPPTPSWGGMIAEGRDSIRLTPHLVLIPCFVMFMTIYSCNALGDYVRGRFAVRGSQL